MILLITIAVGAFVFASAYIVLSMGNGTCSSDASLSLHQIYFAAGVALNYALLALVLGWIIGG